MAVRNVLLIMADQLRKDKLIRYDDGNCDFTDFGLRGAVQWIEKISCGFCAINFALMR